MAELCMLVQGRCLTDLNHWNQSPIFNVNEQTLSCYNQSLTSKPKTCSSISNGVKSSWMSWDTLGHRTLPISGQYALTCSPTKHQVTSKEICLGPSMGWEQQVLVIPTLCVDSPHEAHIADNNTGSESSRTLHDSDHEDSDWDTSDSNSLDEEPELLPRQIWRNESKKQSSYTHPMESKEERSEQAQGSWTLCDKCTNKYTLTLKAREILRICTLEISSTTPVNKIYAKPWIQSFTRFRWRRLQFQEVTAHHCTPSSIYSGPTAHWWSHLTSALQATLENYKSTPGRFTSVNCTTRVPRSNILLLQQELFLASYRRRRGKEPVCAGTVSATLTSPPGGVFDISMDEYHWSSPLRLHYHWRASLDALRAWSCWASSEIHGYYMPGRQLRYRTAGH